MPKNQIELHEDKQSRAIRTDSGFNRVLGVAVDIYAQRMLLQRSINPIDLFSDQNDPFQQDDEMKKPKLGCPYDLKISRISYFDEVATVKKNNPTFSDHEVRVRAAMLFRPKHQSHRESLAQERSGQKEYKSIATFTIEDGKLIYTNKGYEGTSIEDFSERQLRLMPEIYSLTDHQTNMAIRDRFIDGAREIVTAYTREGEDNRDILVMKYDPDREMGTIHVINTEMNEKCHTFEKLTEIAKEHFPQLNEFRTNTGVFLLSDTPIEPEHMQEVIDSVEVHAKQEIAKYEQKKQDEVIDRDTIEPEQLINPLGRETLDVVQRVSHHAYVTFFDAVRYIKEKQINNKKKDEIEKKPILLQSFSTAPNPTLLAGSDTGIWERLTAISKKIISKNSSTEHEWRQIIEKAFGITRTQSEQLIEVIESVWEKMVGMRRTITIIQELGGAAIGALWPELNTLASEPFLPEEDRPIKQNEMWRPTKEQTDIIVDYLLPPKQIQSKRKENILFDVRLHNVDIIVLSWVKEFIERTDALPPKKIISLIQKEQTRIVGQMELLAEIFNLLTRKLTEENEHEIHTSFEKLQSSIDKKVEWQEDHDQSEYAVNFSIALTLWLFLKYITYYETLGVLKTYLKDSTYGAGTLVIQNIRESLLEGLVQQEGTSWLLLAIIWYLAMLREQGVVKVSVPKQKSKTKKTQRQNAKWIRYPFERQAVIFAFSS